MSWSASFKFLFLIVPVLPKMCLRRFLIVTKVILFFPALYSKTTYYSDKTASFRDESDDESTEITFKGGKCP